MKQWQAWLIALTSALAGATVTQLVQPLADGVAHHTAAELGVACEPSDDRRKEGRSWPEPAQHAVDPIEPKLTRTAPAALNKLAGQGPLSMLTLEQRKTLLRHKYGGLFRELDLSPEDADRLLDVLCDQEQRSLERALSGRAGLGLVSEAQASRAQTQIAEAIGSRNAAAFVQLREALPARFELRRMRDQLEDAGEHMSSEQQRAMLDIISAQGSNSPPSPREGESLEDAALRYRTWASERDSSLRQSAAAVLSPTQLKTLDDSRLIREAMRPALGSASRRMSARAGSGG